VKPWVVEQYAVMLGNRQLGAAVAMRIDFLERAMGDAFFLGFSMLNYSPIRAREIQANTEGVTVHVRVNGTEIGIFCPSIDRITYGFILGVTPLGLGRFTPDVSYTIFRSTGPRYAFWRAMREKERFQSLTTEMLFTVPREERESIPRSPRINVYGVHRHAQEQIRVLVYKMTEGMDAFTRNKYYAAALELAYRERVSHSRLHDWKTMLSEDEFKRVWLEKWQALGLNTSILNTIYEQVRQWQKILVKEKTPSKIIV
ncbi:MAG: hypothetical protein ACP5IE_10360, partial [Infirmifilum sp.]